jgi:DNA-binding transcriptional LysR family regulator
MPREPVRIVRAAAGEIDFAFIVGSFQSSEVDSRHVARHGLMALLPPDHKLAAKKIISRSRIWPAKRW